MALTLEFENAVRARNLLKVRIMLKDSLLVDKKFYQFKEMITYAEGCGVNFWMEKTKALKIAPKTEWNTELMNLELTRLVNDFTKERLAYCQSIIKKVYGITLYHDQAYQQTTVNYPNSQTQSDRPVSSNSNDYNSILKGASEIDKILRKNKSKKGDRTWKHGDVDAILAAAKKISAACENIKSRRG